MNTHCATTLKLTLNFANYDFHTFPFLHLLFCSNLFGLYGCKHAQHCAFSGVFDFGIF